MKLIKSLSVLALIAILLTACFGSNAANDAISGNTTDSEAATETVATLTAVTKTTTSKKKPGTITLKAVFGKTTFDRPVGVIARKDHPKNLYILQQSGQILSMNLDRPSDKPKLMLDITDRVYDENEEQGLLGLAFHPDDPGKAYVNYTTKTHTVISRFDVMPKNPEQLNPKSEKIVLKFEQPYANHNGGQLAFGPDGYLYIGTGDGGGSGDQDNNSQNLKSLLGKILRIDVDHPAKGLSYGIPSDNPFLKGGRPEIFAYGLRNPWRFSFDKETGKLWVGDVGQGKYEEIDIIEKGGNYGWRIMEATTCFSPKDNCKTKGLKPPIYSYDHNYGSSVTGGYVYRGSARPDLKGWYIFGDFSTGNIWALRSGASSSPEVVKLLASDKNIASFGVDAAGELYVCAYDGQILRVK